MGEPWLDHTDVLDGRAGADVLIGDRDDTCISGVPLGCRDAAG